MSSTFGDGGEDRQLILPPGRAWSEDRTGGLRAQPLIPGIGEQSDARGEGQQLDQGGLADLGQIMNASPGGSVRRTAAAPRHR